MYALQEYFINYLNTLISGVDRALTDGSCTRSELLFERMALDEFKANILADSRFNNIIKSRVGSLELNYFEIEHNTLSERIIGIFRDEAGKRLAHERKTVRLILIDYREMLLSLKIFASHYSLGKGLDNLSAKYLTFSSI